MRRLLQLAAMVTGSRAIAQRSRKWGAVAGGLVIVRLLDGAARAAGRRATRRSV